MRKYVNHIDSQSIRESASVKLNITNLIPKHLNGNGKRVIDHGAPYFIFSHVYVASGLKHVI